MTPIIEKRYSCREFQARDVPVALLREVMRAGMQAPSARNERPWEFHVVSTAETRGQLAAASPYAGCCAKAPSIIVVSANLERVQEGSPWWIQDVSACIENMLLAATALDLGSVWLGLYPRMERVKAVQRILRLPETMVPVAALPIGYPKKENRTGDRFDETRIHWEDRGEGCL